MAISVKKIMQWQRFIFYTRSVCISPTGVTSVEGNLLTLSRSTSFSCVRASIRICYCDEFSHFLFLCCFKTTKPVIPARKQALKDKEKWKKKKNQQRLQTVWQILRTVTTSNTADHGLKISVKNSISLQIHLVVILSSSKTTSEQQRNRPNPTTFLLIHYTI